MLKGIPPILSPDLIKALMEMGHGDEIVLADGNFPAASHANQLIPAHGHGTEELLKAILELFPLDTYVVSPVMLMGTVDGDPCPDIWNRYEEIIKETSDSQFQIEKIDRFDFYTRSRKAYVIVATSERSPYANIILKKGVL
ncbi:RbsD/FucU family protein [Fredinandcohnia onubensis]|uniref:RbsD/FucU family protein n=1 Tax=Fredinandcohnia onubensis TaxID=1571209 RepID=UPI000C0BBEBB|nr:RbsD/FucU domain-containing protein [Fredinandcohnia onubensis]